MAPSPQRPGFAGGFLVAVCLAIGTIIGLIVGQPSIGFLVGLSVGALAAVALWLKDRR